MDISSLSVGIFTWMLQNFPKNSAILVLTLCGEKKLSKSVFSYFKLEGGGGKASVAWPLVDELFFCGFPYSSFNFESPSGNISSGIIKHKISHCNTAEIKNNLNHFNVFSYF